VAASLAFLSACAGAETPAGTPEPGRVRAFDGMEGVQVRAGQVPITSEDHSLIMLAEERLIQRCMAEEGFDQYGIVVANKTRYLTPPPPANLSPDELRRSGYLFDWERASRGMAAADPRDPSLDPTAGMSQAERDAFVAALGGRPDAPTVEVRTRDGTTVMSGEGCEAEARIELYGSLENYLRFNDAAEFLPGAVTSALREMEGYREALDAWQGCMRAEGHGVHDEDDSGFPYLMDRLRSALAAGKAAPVPEEIRAVAEADAACQESSGLHEVRQRHLAAARDAATERFGFEMSEIVAFEHAVLERAKRVP
jgi:hypothetical protein